MVATRGRTFKRPWRRSCHSSKLKSSSVPIGRKDSWRFHAVGSSNAPLLGSTAAEGLQRIGRTSTATRWRSCGLPQSASCSENFVIPPDVFGQTLRGYVRFTPKSGQTGEVSTCPLCAKSGRNAVHKKHCYSMTSSAVLDSLAWHPRFDPRLQHFDEVLVRERGSRALARGPGPEDERIRLHVLDDLLSRATAAIARRVLDLFADLLLAPAFPQHGQGREVPVRDARHEPVGRVHRLMAGLARLRGGAMAVLSADNERHMNGPGIALPGGLVLMAVDASRVHDDARDRLERPGGSGVWCVDDTSGNREQADDQAHDRNRHRLLLKPSAVDSRAAASGCACRWRQKPRSTPRQR